MEFKITKFEPVAVKFNYEEIKKELVEKVDIFKHIVYTNETIKTAKTDRSELNKVKKALNDKRIEVQKEYMKPFDTFKGQVDELIDYVNESIENVDMQVKDYEARAKVEKEVACRAKFAEKNRFDWLTYEKVSNAKWLLVSTSMSSVEEDMDFTLNGIEASLNALKGIEYESDAVECFKRTLSLAEAMGESKRLSEMAKRLEVKSEPKPEPKPVIETIKDDTEPREWMDLKVKINPNEFDALTEWLNEQGIEWSIT